MKKVHLILFLIIFSIGTGFSQRTELYGFSGYMLSGNVYTYTGDGNILSDVNYGGALDYEIADGTMLELLYIRKDTRFDYYNYLDIIQRWEQYDLSVEYYHIGALKELKDGKVRPYGAFTLGFTRFHVKDANFYDAYRFSIAPGAGLKIYLTDNIGIRLQGRLLLPLEFYGLGLFYSSSSGMHTTASFSVPVVQGDFTGGIFLSF